MTRVKARALAQAIADDLFVAGDGEHADRLVLWVDADERNLGGWSKRAVIDRIEQQFLASAGVDRQLQVTVSGTRLTARSSQR